MNDRFLFFPLHPGHLRPYLPVVEELRRRGHRVRVAFVERAQRDADRTLVALAARGLDEAGRYADPRSRHARALLGATFRRRATGRKRVEATA